ncbi:response regulator [Paenibacillus agricola]|uniref:Response regulator n=1 Tax=Paenibacillus agricola TaxID=2716264 RepID=A0ABX0J9C2_9BACL|nr:response regulator [Paenibacillus agricola]NHN31906.1 response regulator [Paenibacillus agricola]
MYTMMLVEDETIILEGLKACLDWPSLGIEIIGEAADGAAALKLAQALRPDIILTDVVMYGMDGIEFVSRLRDEAMEKQPQVIVISGHENWSYMKSALQLKVTDYLLKPFDTEELQQVIIKAKKACDADRDHNESIRKLEIQVSSSQSLVMERFLQDCCLSKQTPEEWSIHGEYLDMEALQQQAPFRAVYLECLPGYAPLQEGIKEKLRLLHIFPLGKGKYGGLADRTSGLDEPAKRQWIHDQQIKLRVGSPVNSLEQIHESFRQARTSMIQRSLLSESEGKSYSDSEPWDHEQPKLSPQLQAEQEQFFERKAALEEAVITELENNDQMNRVYSIRLYFDWFRKFDRQQVPYLQAFCGILLMQIKQRFAVLVESGNVDFVSESIEAMGSCLTDEDLEEYMVNLLDHLADLIHSKPDQRKVVRSIMDLNS